MKVCRFCPLQRRSRPVAGVVQSTSRMWPRAMLRSRTLLTSTSTRTPCGRWAVVITGAQVKEWLERSAGIFNQVAPGTKDAALIDPTFPSYNFDVIDGVTYKIDLSQPSKYGPKGELMDANASRITDLSFEGAPVDPAQKFVVATNNYRAGGGGNFPDINDEVVVFVGPDTNRDVLVRFIVEKGTINPSADANWTFKPMDGNVERVDPLPLREMRHVAVPLRMAELQVCRRKFRAEHVFELLVLVEHSQRIQ